VTPLVAAVAGLWLVRVAVEVRRWYWQREAERAAGWYARLQAEADERARLSHVRLRPMPFDQDSR
jgi:hypothetical protein